MGSGFVIVYLLDEPIKQESNNFILIAVFFPAEHCVLLSGHSHFMRYYVALFAAELKKMV